MTDYDLGTDIRVFPDLDLDEVLVEDIDCLIQDLRLRLDNPQGLFDGTEEGEDWGFDLKGFLNAGFRPQKILELIVNLELEIEKDDRVDQARVQSTDWNPLKSSLSIVIRVELGQMPYLLSVQATKDTVDILRV